MLAAVLSRQIVAPRRRVLELRTNGSLVVVVELVVVSRLVGSFASPSRKLAASTNGRKFVENLSGRTYSYGRVSRQS
jgi:hypothetical protein